MSISKIQSKNLNFLDNLSKNNISEAEAAKQYADLPEVIKILSHYGAKVFADNAIQIINQEDIVYTGSLKDLLTFSITDKGQKYLLSVGYKKDEPDYPVHWQFVNYGVKGIRSGRSIKGYSFKTANPSKRMVDAMSEYIKVSGSKVRTINPITTREQSQEEIAKQQAYALAKVIKMQGIKPREYMERAAAKTFNKDFASEVAMAVGRDIKIYIRQWQ